MPELQHSERLTEEQEIDRLRVECSTRPWIGGGYWSSALDQRLDGNGLGQRVEGVVPAPLRMPPAVTISSDWVVLSPPPEQAFLGRARHIRLGWRFAPLLHGQALLFGRSQRLLELLPVQPVLVCHAFELNLPFDLLVIAQEEREVTRRAKCLESVVLG